jgi:hypothetical protein
MVKTGETRVKSNTRRSLLALSHSRLLVTPNMIFAHATGSTKCKEK